MEIAGLLDQQMGPYLGSPRKKESYSEGALPHLLGHRWVEASSIKLALLFFHYERIHASRLECIKDWSGFTESVHQLLTYQGN